jgi:excisionase family DNA binding protein
MTRPDQRRGGKVIAFPGCDVRRIEPFLTKKQLAALLAVSERWIEIAVRDRGAPHHRLGKGVVRFKLEEFLRWGERDAQK